MSSTKPNIIDQYLIDNIPQSTEAIDAEIKGSEEHNTKCREIEAFKKKEAELLALEEQSGNLTVLVDTGRQMIQDCIKDLELPIKGLSFDDKNVYYYGKMIHQDTMSKAEQTMFEAQLKMIGLTNTEVLFIGSGESIGLKLLRELQVECDKLNIQIIMEEDERGTEALELRIMPDYSDAQK